MSEDRARNAVPPAAEPNELRTKILEASIALIEEEGLARLSMREVARRAGVTHQAPYHYFADREAILGEIAEQGFRLLSAGIQHATRDAEGAQLAPTACIVAMGRAYVEFACTHPAHFRIMFRPELVDMENCPGARAEGDHAFGTLTRIVHDAVEAGLPAVPSEAALIALLWSVGHGLSCLLLDGPLAEKMPEAQRNDVLSALGSLLEASVSQASRKRAVQSRPRARVSKARPADKPRKPRK
jgi:AcrR family transcriptional regulator